MSPFTSTGQRTSIDLNITPTVDRMQSESPANTHSIHACEVHKYISLHHQTMFVIQYHFSTDGIHLKEMKRIQFSTWSYFTIRLVK